MAIVPKLNRGFISDGGGGIVVFDLKTYAVLGTINSEKDSDGIIYDARTERVLVVSGDGGDLPIISIQNLLRESCPLQFERFPETCCRAPVKIP